VSDPRETRRKSKGALYLQGRASPSLGANDPRIRRSAQARTTSELTGAYVRFDEQGRVTIDYDALRTQLQSDLNLSSDAAVTAAQLAGAYLTVSQDGALDVDYDALLSELRLALPGGPPYVFAEGVRIDEPNFESTATPVPAGRQPVVFASVPTSRTVGGSTYIGPSMFRRLQVDASYTNSNAVQPWFPTFGSVAVAADRVYHFRGRLALNRGSTSASVGVGFSTTATITTIDYTAIGQSQAVGTAGATQQSSRRNDIPILLTAPASTADSVWVTVEGIVSFADAGTLTPEFQFSAAPGAGTIAAETFFFMWEMGEPGDETRGDWS
jgi:hypothetical protein